MVSLFKFIRDDDDDLNKVTIDRRLMLEVMNSPLIQMIKTIRKLSVTIFIEYN